MRINYREIIDKDTDIEKWLDPKKQQTDNKINYVFNYVRDWLHVMENKKDINNVVFIDCMCNAGIYKDGDLATSTRILKLFSNFIKSGSNKKYRIILNDNSEERIKISKTIVDELKIEDTFISQVIIEYNNSDVNDFLANYDYLDNIIKNSDVATILFVDPYNFRTVNIPILGKFLGKYYCEIIFNVFTSDYVRNKIDNRIKNCINNYEINNLVELLAYIKNILTTNTHIKYVFSYSFKNIKNNEIYQIFYGTPHIKGLEKLKDILWDTFKGESFYHNDNSNMIPLFSDDDMKEQNIIRYAKEAKKKVYDNFMNKTVTYDDIMIYVLENTILKRGQIIKNVIKPLINDKLIKKCGIVNNPNNYTKDHYRFE